MIKDELKTIDLKDEMRNCYTCKRSDIIKDDFWCEYSKFGMDNHDALSTYECYLKDKKKYDRLKKEMGKDGWV